MPNQSEGTAAAPATQEEFVSRKLIRPALAPQNRSSAPPAEHGGDRPRPSRNNPTDQTHAETFYYQKQIQARTQVSVALRNGEVVDGVLEWYDRDCVRLIRRDQSNLLIYKSSIKYIYKTAEGKK